jgi:hypothetical protein
MNRPIKPHEVDAARAASLPPEVFESFNDCIIKYWNGSSSQFKQAEVAGMIAFRLNWEDTKRIYEANMLDVEKFYRNEGWNVSYHKPDYNEVGEAYFVFRK